MMKRGTLGQMRLDFFYSQIGSTLSANITISKNAISYMEQQPIIDDSSNLFDMQTDDHNIVEPTVF